MRRVTGGPDWGGRGRVRIKKATWLLGLVNLKLNEGAVKTLNPGDVRTFEEGKRIALVVGLGVWAEKRGDWIDIHLTGTEKFHTTVTNQVDSERYHRTLFRNLRGLLRDHGRWQFGDQGAETETRT